MSARKKVTNPTDARVGSRVRMRRLMLSMTQEQLAEGLGVTFQQVQKYENGANRISASRLVRICEILMVPPSFFFDSSSVDTKSGDLSAEDFDSFFATSEGLSLSRAFVKIKNKATRRTFVALVESIADADPQD
jgi:transcriptional regulator with XRE-family HTH domain